MDVAQLNAIWGHRVQYVRAFNLTQRLCPGLPL
jgi:hypothetical protein